MNASRVLFVAAAFANACSISTSARRVLVRSLSLCFCETAADEIPRTRASPTIKTLRDIESPLVGESYHRLSGLTIQLNAALGRGFLWYASSVAEQRSETGSIPPLGRRLWW